MKSLPTTTNGFQAEENNNSQQMELLFRQFFPEFPYFVTPFDDLFRIMMYLEQTRVNPEILPKVIRGVHNIIIGTGQGEVVVHIRGNSVTVDTREKENDVITTQK